MKAHNINPVPSTWKQWKWAIYFITCKHMKYRTSTILNQSNSINMINDTIWKY